VLVAGGYNSKDYFMNTVEFLDLSSGRTRPQQNMLLYVKKSSQHSFTNSLQTDSSGVKTIPYLVKRDLTANRKCCKMF
jgi:hypothetical protein